jgi:hypothetical protein
MRCGHDYKTRKEKDEEKWVASEEFYFWKSVVCCKSTDVSGEHAAEQIHGGFLLGLFFNLDDEGGMLLRNIG